HRIVLPIANANGALSLEQDRADDRLRLDSEIRPRRCGTQVGHRRAAAAAIADGRLTAAEALLLAAVVVGCRRMAGAGAGLEKCVQQWIGEIRMAHAERTGIPAIVVAALGPRLRAPK